MQHVLCYPNPVTFSINEVTIGISTSDILFHLASEEVSRQPADAPSDRLTRLAEHIVQQQLCVSPSLPLGPPERLVTHSYRIPSSLRRFYPLHPPATGAQLDLERMQQMELPVTPDILILPSDLKTFAKVRTRPAALGAEALARLPRDAHADGTAMSRTGLERRPLRQSGPPVQAQSQRHMGPRGDPSVPARRASHRRHVRFTFRQCCGRIKE